MKRTKQTIILIQVILMLLVAGITMLYGNAATVPLWVYLTLGPGMLTCGVGLIVWNLR